jgi:hypothetical protein
MPGGRWSACALAALLLWSAFASASHAGDDAAPGERETREAVRSVGELNDQARQDLCARLTASPHARWAAVTALECVAAAEDRLQKAVAERDKQGGKMFSFFLSRVARDFENRAKFTEFRVMELENRNLCKTVQDWSATLACIEDAAQKATAKVTGDAEGAAAVADRVRRLVGLSRRGSQQAAVLSSLRGDAVRPVAPDAHGWSASVSDRELSTAALRLLALVPDTVDVAKLTPCASSVDPVIRRVTYRLLEGVASVAAMDVLIARLEFEEGVPSGELITHLHALTEQTFPDAKLWAEWWATHREGWKREEERVAQAEKIEKQPYSRYFGLELRSARVLFVFDRSGSMSWSVGHKAGDDNDAFGKESKMEVAQRELTAAVQGLDERTSFNIVGFSSNFEPFQRRPVRATRENREKAVKWIAKLTPDGQTNLAGSLLLAFDNTRPSTGAADDAIADTIVVLTDGAPNCGPIAYENDTLAELKRLNPDGMVTIHAIFLGVDGDEKFMKSLAADHGGKFIHHK